MNYYDIVKEDHNYKYLSKSDIDEIINRACISAGEVCAKYDIDKIYEYLANENVKVIRTENNSDYKYRARIDINNKTRAIYIYEDMLIQDARMYNLKYEQLLNLYLAHEFFHLLEYNKVVNLNYYIEKKFLRFINRKVNILAISEVAANYFAFNLCGVDINKIDKEFYEL